jgi:hypothetical protein
MIFISNKCSKIYVICVSSIYVNKTILQISTLHWFWGIKSKWSRNPDTKTKWIRIPVNPLQILSLESGFKALNVAPSKIGPFLLLTPVYASLLSTLPFVVSYIKASPFQWVVETNASYYRFPNPWIPTSTCINTMRVYSNTIGKVICRTVVQPTNSLSLYQYCQTAVDSLQILHWCFSKVDVNADMGILYIAIS